MPENEALVELQPYFERLQKLNSAMDAYEAGIAAPAAQSANVINLETVRNRKGFGRRAAAAVSVAAAAFGVASAQLPKGASHEAAVVASYAPDHDIAVNHDLNNIELIADADTPVEVHEIGVVGEAPCGPKIDDAEARRRLTAGETVSKPSEVASFFDAHPEIETGLNNFYENINGFKDVYDWIVKNVDVTTPEIVKGHEGSMIRELKARETGAILNQDVAVQNHQCEFETGRIYPVNNITVLQEGEQVWTINLTADQVKEMQKAGVELPDGIIVLDNLGDKNVDLALVLERIACNNPLLEREVPKHQETTTTTRPATTTSQPSTTTTSQPTTTTTRPTTTTTVVTTTTTQPTTTTTTRPTTTTTTTIPNKEVFCVTPDGSKPVHDMDGDGDIDANDVHLTPGCEDVVNTDPGSGGEPGPEGTTSTTSPNNTTTTTAAGGTTPTTGVYPTSTLPPIPAPTSTSTTAPDGPGPDPSVTPIP
jgi:hypothetical protein